MHILQFKIMPQKQCMQQDILWANAISFLSSTHKKKIILLFKENYSPI